MRTLRSGSSDTTPVDRRARITHHKHSYYLIKNGDLRGFEPDEIERIALIARYHRQNLPRKSHDGFVLLSRTDRTIVKRLAAMLRLAEGLDRSHTQSVAGLRLNAPATKRAPWTCRLTTSGDAELELWAAGRHSSALAGELDRALVFQARPGGSRVPARAASR